MFRILRYFSRSRSRADMKIQPRFKKFEQQFSLKERTKQLRKQYNLDKAENEFQPFSQILKSDKPKLQQQKVFKIDEQKLRKKITNKYNEAIDDIQQNHSQNLMKGKDFLEYKSRLYDQAQEIQYQKQFKKQLFRKKETVMRVRKQVQKPQNYLSQSTNHQVIEYLQAKKDIKNIRTQNILEGQKTNKFLQKIIESGLLDDTEKLKRSLQAYQSGQHLKQHNQIKLLSNSDMTIVDYQQKQIIKSSKLLEQVRQQTQEEKLKIVKTLNLMQKVKNFEDRQFEKRYDAINFRYKGKVDFDWYKQPELLSYIKHQVVAPKQLLMVFSQNLNRLNKDKMLIMTPAILNQIYAKTSTYNFPQTKQNNRINMLADKNFTKLQYMIFTNLDKIDDRGFTDAVYSFSKNHKEELGALRPKQFDRILQAISNQFEDRAGYIEQTFLGAICRSLVNLPFTKQDSSYDIILNKLNDRIEHVKDLYSLQSICMFCSLINTQKSKQIISKSIETFYNSSDWNPATLVNSSKFFSSLLLGPKKQQYKKNLLVLFTEMDEQIHDVVPKININNLQGLATFLLALGLQTPKVWNSIKKQMTDSLSQQKSLLKQNTVPTLVSSFSFVDYRNKYNCKNIELHSLINEFLIRRPIRHNSSLFKTYHQSAKYLSDQNNATPIKGKMMIIKALAFAGYPNKAFFDTFIYDNIKAANEGKKDLQTLIELIHCHILLRRQNSMTDYMVEKIKQVNIVPYNLRIQTWINYFCCLGNCYFPTTSMKYHLQKVYVKIQAYLWDITNAQRIAILSSLIQFGMKNSIEAQQVLSSIQTTQMSNNQQLLLSMCLQFINSNSGRWSSLKNKFNQLQISYYKNIKQDVLQNEFALGSMFSFQKLQKDFASQKQKEGKKVVSLPWRVQVHDGQVSTVYFFYTYDMLIGRQNDKGQIINMFPTGIWRMYLQMYELQGYKVEVFKTYEFKKTFNA